MYLRKYVVALAAAAALFMEFLDLTILNVAMPVFSQQFDAPSARTHWVVTIYMLTLAACVLASGWLQRRFGSKQVFMAAVTLFTFASMFCGLSNSLPALIAWRAAQGVAAGMMSPVGLSLVLQTYSHEERSRIMGLMFAPSFLAMVVAPFLGGIIMSYASWPWIFYVNIPVGLTTLWVIHRHVQNPSHKRVAGRFDTAGFMTSSLGMGALFAGLSRAGEQARPDALSLLLMTAGLVSLVLFLWIESSQAQPLIDVRIFLEPLFAAGTLVQFILISAVNGSLFAFTMWQQQVLGRTPFVTGLLCAVQAMAYVGTVIFASRLTRIWGERRLVLWGIAVFTGSVLLLLSDSVMQDVPWTIATLLMRGVGMGLCLPVSWNLAFKSTRSEHMDHASASMSAMIQLGCGFGMATTGVLLTLNPGAHLLTSEQSSFKIALVVSAFSALVAAAVALTRIRLPLNTEPSSHTA